MTHLWQYAAETPPEPIWLRTLAIVLPVAGTVTVAILTGPKIVGRIRERQKARREGTDPSEDSPAIAAQVAVAATEQAVGNPILRLFIDDLHQRLSSAHEEAARLHGLRAVDAATIARLTEELAHTEGELTRIITDANGKVHQNKELRTRLRQLRRELEETRAQLRDCYEEGDRRDAAERKNSRP